MSSLYSALNAKVSLLYSALYVSVFYSAYTPCPDEELLARRAHTEALAATVEDCNTKVADAEDIAREVYVLAS